MLCTQKRETFLHHRSSAIHALTDNFWGTAFITLIRYVHLASVFNVILIFLLWYLIGLISWLSYLFVLRIYSITLSFNISLPQGVIIMVHAAVKQAYNLGPAIIVENLLWSTLFLVRVLNVLPCIVFSSYLVSDIFLFPVLVWKVVEGVFCLVLLLFYTAI